MYQNKYPKMIISIDTYSINRPEAGYERGGLHIYVHALTCIYVYICIHTYIFGANK